MRYALMILLSSLLLLASCTSHQNRRARVRVDSRNSNQVGDVNIQNVFLSTGWYYVLDSEAGLKRMVDRQGRKYFLNPEPFVPINNVASVTIDKTTTNKDDYSKMTIELDEHGTKVFEAITDKSYGKKLALVVCNQLLSAPKVQGTITTGKVSISVKGYSEDEMYNFRICFEDEKKQLKR